MRGPSLNSSCYYASKLKTALLENGGQSRRRCQIDLVIRATFDEVDGTRESFRIYDFDNDKRSSREELTSMLWVGADGTLRTNDLPMRGRTGETYDVNRSRVLYAFKVLDRDGRLPVEAQADHRVSILCLRPRVRQN